MWLHWLPWKWLIRRVACSHGFLDPFTILARLEKFSQPADVAVPVELLRFGLVIHARALVNSRAIQHNLDWVWPYWVHRQYNARDVSYLPRGFSNGNVNLTHRNWTAVGVPDCNALPVVDPRGLLTPLLDGWSLDGWIVDDAGAALLPSRLPAERVTQEVRWGEDDYRIETCSEGEGLRLSATASVAMVDGAPLCRFVLRGLADRPAWLLLNLRPANPEGVAQVESIRLRADRETWVVDGETRIHLTPTVERHVVSDYHGGDIHFNLDARPEGATVECPAGLAQGAALYRLEPGRERTVSASVDLRQDKSSTPVLPKGTTRGWRDSLHGLATVALPDTRAAFLYDAGLRAMILHSPHEVYPGPFTYKHFWFRDAAIILNAMLAVGLFDRAEAVIDLFPKRQTLTGFFHSQEGEWDSNGQALWTMMRYCRLRGVPPKPEWRRAILSGARWIGSQRVSIHLDARHAGLLPAGFSAEHFGTNDYYFWDDFWGVAGLRAAAWLAEQYGERAAANEFAAEAEDLLHCTETAIARNPEAQHEVGVPSSPYKRFDSGAVGSIVADYPLQVWGAGDPRILQTAETLMARNLMHGGLFHEISHAGINAYLTLHLAQALLRAGDPRAWSLAEAVAALASPTGNWPEAIHPKSLGGCMGDGQHLWAVAEWVMMVRNMLLREEGEALVLLSGVPEAWLDQAGELAFGPAPTPHGPVTLALTLGAERPDGEPPRRRATLRWSGEWRSDPPPLSVRLRGYQPVDLPSAVQGEIELTPHAEAEAGPDGEVGSGARAMGGSRGAEGGGP